MKKLLVIGILSGLSLFAQSSVPSVPPPSAAPEPAAIALMGLGMAGIGFAAWRQKKKQ